ncbi:DUF4296 domain-containing protein [Flavobacterium sp. J27]|uniref:DUF4296 domain-containing protein n=1 Tax=Flavobacterium sp. J27 TaxID=2060419 RepID=UPI00102F59B8|nr:DUF4296 domain-containing protein [Flavobacterium sp. J27]
MKKIIFLALLVCFSCNENPVSKPDRLLDEDIMVDILYDTALLQAAESYLPNTLTENKIRIKNYIYLKYNIDSVTYYQNQRYYASDFKKYKNMFEQVSERIERNKTEIDTLLAQEKRNRPDKKDERNREFAKRFPQIKKDSVSSQ